MTNSKKHFINAEHSRSQRPTAIILQDHYFQSYHIISEIRVGWSVNYTLHELTKRDQVELATCWSSWFFCIWGGIVSQIQHLVRAANSAVSHRMYTECLQVCETWWKLLINSESCWTAAMVAILMYNSLCHCTFLKERINHCCRSRGMMLHTPK